MKIENIKGLEKGMTYHVVIGTIDVIPSNEDLDKIKDQLNEDYPNMFWIVTNARFNIRSF
jgi:hypothetical protein